MTQKTKIIATLGPASDSPEILRGMIRAGMNVARLNFSHGNHAEHSERIARLREVANELQANIAIMADTRGFEIRTGLLREGSIQLESGQEFMLYSTEQEGDQNGVSVTYGNLHKVLHAGQAIMIDDGLIELQIVDIYEDRIVCKVIAGGQLKNRKGVNIPSADLGDSPLSEQDKEDILFAIEQDLDYIAASFINNAAGVAEIRAFVQKNGGNMPIIAKIENQRAMDNLTAIVLEADGTMVARGDLGVEVPVEQVPLMQKKIIRTTVMNGKPVITATQMLDSMERNPRPTRAESTDVANAIFDGTSAIMLSGETAAGKYPVEAVRTMVKLSEQAEGSLSEYGYLQKINAHPSHRVTEAVSQAAIAMAAHLDAAAIITLTQSGFTSRSISKYRPKCPILAITQNANVVRKLAMNWGVFALLCSAEQNDSDMIADGLRKAREHGFVRSGDRVVVTAGLNKQVGSTNMIRVVTVESTGDTLY